MARAIAQARRALGRTSPNPAVGCVITHRGQIVAEGFHSRAGAPHAEVEAIRRLRAPAHECDLYVTLEPCCMHGRTPPCTEAILAAGFRRVLIGSRDPDPRVDGRGVERLRERGVEVVQGVLRQPCDALLMPFAKRVLTGLPLVVAKYAMSLDGKIAASTGDSGWITGPESRAQVHVMRDQLDAIMVGAQTLRRDQPRLTCRAPQGRDPMRVLLDPRLEAPPHSPVYDPDSSAPVLVLAQEDASALAEAALIEANPRVEVLRLPPDARGWLPLEPALRAVAQRGCNSLLVEGGQALLGSLLDERLIDQVVAFIAPTLLGGLSSPSPLGGQGVALASLAARLERVQVQTYGEDLCVSGELPQTWRAYPLSAWLERP